MNKLAAASVAYDAEGWQPAFREFIPQMTVDMFVNMEPFAEEYRKLAADPDGFPALVEKLIALEHEPMAWEEDVRALEVPVLIISGDADVATLEHSVAPGRGESHVRLRRPCADPRRRPASSLEEMQNGGAADAHEARSV